MTGIRKELKSRPITLETRLGWTLLGRTNIQSSSRGDATLLAVSMFVQEASVRLVEIGYNRHNRSSREENKRGTSSSIERRFSTVNQGVQQSV